MELLKGVVNRKRLRNTGLDSLSAVFISINDPGNMTWVQPAPSPNCLALDKAFKSNYLCLVVLTSSKVNSGLSQNAFENLENRNSLRESTDSIIK